MQDLAAVWLERHARPAGNACVRGSAVHIQLQGCYPCSTVIPAGS
jgi:hypothetical protein